MKEFNFDIEIVDLSELNDILIYEQSQRATGGSCAAIAKGCVCGELM